MPDLDVVLENRVDVAAAVIDHVQALAVAMIDDGLDPRLVVGPPVVGPHERALLVGHVAPDHEPVQPRPGGLDRRLGAVQVELPHAVEHRPEALRLQGHPQHVVLRADEPRHALGALAHAAVDGEIGPERLDRLDPGRRVPLETVAHAGNLVVARREVTPPVVRIVELGRLELSPACRSPRR